MIKYTDTRVTFSEIPDEVTLCINISGCPCHCEGCHSSYLAEDIGTRLDCDWLDVLVHRNKGISCISFMGGDADPATINLLAHHIRNSASWSDAYVGMKIAWYSGRQELAKEIDISNFDYIKLGPYIADRGPLNDPNTNQRMYKIEDGKMLDITNKFWKK